jgi:arylsulfatase A-like enzyme
MTAHLLDALRRVNVYDRTAVLVMADHGMNANSYPDSPASSADAWKRLAGSANPLFLFKPLDSRGPLHTSPATVSVIDVGATLCAATGACTAPAGIPAGRSGPNQLRRFDHYVWRHGSGRRAGCRV